MVTRAMRSFESIRTLRQAWDSPIAEQAERVYGTDDGHAGIAGFGVASAYEPPEKDREGKNVGMGTALCSQSVPHKA